jgi:hypothetical protein
VISSRRLPPSAVRIVRDWPTEPHSSGWSVTSRTAGNGPNHRSKIEVSGTGSTHSYACSTGTGMARDSWTTRGVLIPGSYEVQQ